jgi:hypothetical protein
MASPPEKLLSTKTPSFATPLRNTPAPKGLRITAQGQPSLSEATLGMASQLREANPQLRHTPRSPAAFAKCSATIRTCRYSKAHDQYSYSTAPHARHWQNFPPRQNPPPRRVQIPESAHIREMTQRSATTSRQRARALASHPRRNLPPVPLHPPARSLLTLPQSRRPRRSQLLR